MRVPTIYPAMLPLNETGFEIADVAGEWSSVFVVRNGCSVVVVAVVLRPVELDRSGECSRNSWRGIAVFERTAGTSVVEGRT